jgi:hypothetical protein
LSRCPRTGPIIFALAVGLSSADFASAKRAATAQVFDRTFLCSTMPIGGGQYQFEIRAQEGIRESRTTWRSLAFASARIGRITIGPSQLDNSLAWAGAGRASANTNLEEYDTRSPYPAKVHGTLALNQKACGPASARIQLTARGLDGGPAGQLGVEYDCAAPRRVLIRLRATLATRAPFYRERHFLKTKATLQSAYLAIRTQAGKPLAFAAVSQSGKARLFTAPNCVAD